jgi:hypothetical protein
MTTFILIFGVLFRVVPMVGVLWLIWHVSRQNPPTGLRKEREAVQAAARRQPTKVGMRGPGAAGRAIGPSGNKARRGRLPHPV